MTTFSFLRTPFEYKGQKKNVIIGSISMNGDEVGEIRLLSPERIRQSINEFIKIVNGDLDGDKLAFERLKEFVEDADPFRLDEWKN